MCRLCSKYTTCTKLCDKIERQLTNGKKNNGIYADTTEDTTKRSYDSNMLDRILYTKSLDKTTSSKVESVIIAILSPDQKKILNLYSKGYNQVEIANKLGITQSSVSQRIKSIRSSIKDQFHEIIDVII